MTVNSTNSMPLPQVPSAGQMDLLLISCIGINLNGHSLVRLCIGTCGGLGVRKTVLR